MEGEYKNSLNLLYDTSSDRQSHYTYSKVYLMNVTFLKGQIMSKFKFIEI